MKTPRRAVAAEASPGPEVSSVAKAQKPVDVSMLLRLRDTVRQQLDDCTALVQTDEIYCVDHASDEELSTSDTKDLESIMEELKLLTQNKTLALQRMQVGFHLKNKVNQHDKESRLILGSMKQITMLSGTIILHHQEAREKERKLIDIKRKRLSLKKSGEQKILQVYTMIKKTEKRVHVRRSRMLETVRRNIQKERHRITLLQSVFQDILIGSRTNWAEDPSLKAIVLQLEKNVFFM